MGSYKPNRLGLHDMHGNVQEWCRDCYGEKLPGGTDPEVTKDASYRVLRGGSWNGVGRGYCRSAVRGRSLAYRGPSGGFRVAAVQTAAPKTAASLSIGTAPGCAWTISFIRR